jgi:membrane-associated protease RseP (regulator of RpoE activity)
VFFRQVAFKTDSPTTAQARFASPIPRKVLPVLMAEPPRTQFDLNFQVFGFPVRVHPFFWLVGLLLGFTGSGGNGIFLIIWILAMFVSILIHELGHTLMIRRFGRDAHIVLYAMGGLAIEGRPQSSDIYGSPWSLDSFTPGYQSRPRTPHEQILISAAGPGIQFLLAGLVIGIVYATGGGVELGHLGVLPFPIPILGGDLAENRNLSELAQALLYINIFWAIINLLPVLPLDGGQIALQVLSQQDPWGGMQRALWLSVITGGIMAVFGAFVMQSMFMMIMFGSLALSSWLALQQAGGGGGRRPW